MLRFRSIYALPLKTIIGIMFAAMAFWTALSAVACSEDKKSGKAWRYFSLGLTCVAVGAILFYTVVRKTSSVDHDMPFIRTLEHIKAQPEYIREMLMNAFLFFPFGLTLPYSLRKDASKPLKPVWKTVVSALLLSCGIEFIQFIFGIGNAELSDIVMNTTGAVIGTISYLMSQAIIKMKRSFK